MSSILALIRVQWLTHTSYRMNVVFSVLALGALFVPVYLVSNALEPVVADSIADEGAVYFGFLITGMAVMQLVGVSMRGLPDSISGGISSGTLESLFATPTPLPHLLGGMVGYGLLWAGLRSTLLMLGYVVVGGSLVLQNAPLAIAIVVLLVLAHLPVGIVAASFILIFRTAGPLVPGALAAASLLGGVYYSTSVIPEVVAPLSAAVPLTYGLRALRRSLLAGEPLAVVQGDILILALLTVVLLTASVTLFAWSLRYAQRAGSLAQY